MMKRICQDSLANINFEMKWESRQAKHTERYEAQGVNMWRDCLPDALHRELEGKAAGETITIDVEPGDIFPEYDPKKAFHIKESQFDRKFLPDKIIAPRAGRFYPKGLLKGVAGVYPQNLHPFRCVGVRNGGFRVDFNHPLANTAVQLHVTINKIGTETAERGGRCHHWAEIISDGPGMQIRCENRPTEFFEDTPFHRRDNTPDPIFYEKPRLVQHIDDTAVGVVRGIYGRLLKRGTRVLDLMSSWQSHVPAGLGLTELTGLGLNRKELEENRDLHHRIVHDLNEDPVLPFDDDTYDAVICTNSVEYLIRPETVFQELSRVLRPGGMLIVTFSNRWFPPKVIRIWEELHEFERVGLVLEYFHGSGRFEHFETYSVRGLPRPWDDKYFPAMRYSDPIFAVWGLKA